MHLVSRLTLRPGTGVVALAIALLALGCGPAISTPSIHDAEFALEQARLEDAEIYATYEYVSAVEYLAKAQEEWAYSDFQHAERYADRARDFAEQALTRARSNPERSLHGTGGGGDLGGLPSRLGDRDE
jgi:hypothetical protein